MQGKQFFRKVGDQLLIVWGILVHLIVLVAVSDLYFSNRNHQGLKVVDASTDAPPAKRLVLILADGLGYDGVFDSDSSNRLFLYNITRKEGTWGLAQSRFPTVARSGHTAILSGTYESPISAIIQDWTAGPVHTDSLIKQSKRTWFWGSYRILNQFKFHKLSHVHMATYSPYEDDFFPNGKQIVRQIKSFLTKNKYRINLKGSVFDENGILYLIHLPLNDLLDPYERIKDLDNDVEVITERFSQAFADKSTAFVVASSYGLTDWGSHGGDSGSETRTPFIAWGAGIRRNIKQVDIKHIDIAALLACLIGVSIPVNSLGVVPVDYLDLPAADFVSEEATNALQLANIFKAHRMWIKAHSVAFVPYKHLDLDELTDHFARLKMLHFNRKYRPLIRDCKKLIDDLLSGIRYYQTYYNGYLISCILIGYFLWIVYLIGRLSTQMVDQRIYTRSLGGALFLFSIYLSHVRSWPLSYYVYSSFPCIMFYVALPHLTNMITKLPWVVFKNKIYYCIIYILPLQLLLLSTSMRYIVSLAIVSVAATIFIQDSYKETVLDRTKVLWMSLCVVLSILSACPRLGSTIFNLPFLICGFFILVYLFIKWSRRFEFDLEHAEPKRTFTIFAVQNSCFIFVGLYRLFMYFGGAPRIFISGLASIVPIVAIPFTNNAPLVRIAAITFGTAPFYLLTSSFDELVFLAIYVATLLCWWISETSSLKDLDYISVFRFGELSEVNEDQTRIIGRSLMGVVFLFAGFCGAGNEFSPSSYNPKFAQGFGSYSLISAFVIIFKISVPIFICVYIYRAINVASDQYYSKIIYLLLVAIDIILFQMLILFVFYENSWVDIHLTQLVSMTGFSSMVLAFFLLADAIFTSSLLCSKKDDFDK